LFAVRRLHSACRLCFAELFRPIAAYPARILLRNAKFLLEHAMRKPKRTADELTAMIRQRAMATQGGAPWPAKMTMLLYPINDTWEVMVSPGKSVREEEFRITILWIATQMQIEFDLRPVLLTR
jgi:hypothetical protein